uniref:hypothetical protein n=1 Tax=Candidatus Fimivicinus sp. TaxID=3056640 RepID=UPI003FEE4D56
MPTFSAEALQGFKDALSATASGFFGLFKRLLDFILSSPVLFFAVAIPIAGLVFWLIFCLVRNLGERDLETSMGARLYSKELDGAFTNGALITRNAFRKAKKMHDKKKKAMQAANQPKRGYNNSYAAYAAYAARSGKHH